MLRESHPLGLEARHSYDELVRYIETDPTKIKFPDRTASYRRNHPFMTQDDGSKAALGEQKRVIEYRMGDERGPYQPERPRFEAPSSRGSDYDPSEDLFDMFARSQPVPMAPAGAPNTDQSALAAEGFTPPPAPIQPPAPASPSVLSQMTSRVGENVTQGALQAVSQYSQNAAAAALGWIGDGISRVARDELDMYFNEIPAAFRQATITPMMHSDTAFAPTWRDSMRELARRSDGIGTGLLNGPNSGGALTMPLSLRDAPRMIGAASEEASVGAGLFEGAEMGAVAGLEGGPLGILAGGLGGAVLAGGGLMLGGSLFHSADVNRSALTVANEALAHRAGMQNQPFQDFNSINGMNHSAPPDRGGRRFSIGTPTPTRPPSPTADEMLDQMLAEHARRGRPVQSTYGALRDQVTSSSSASGGPSRTRTPKARAAPRSSARSSGHRGPGS